MIRNNKHYIIGRVNILMDKNIPTMLSNTTSTKLADNARPETETKNTIRCLFCEAEMPDQRTYNLHLHYWHPLYSRL